jgi:hypothetical protein
MPRFNFVTKTLGAFFVLILFTGCGLNYTIKDPAVSSINYEKQNIAPSTLTIIDKRTDMDTAFILGQFGAFATTMSKDVPVKLDNIQDPIGYFGQHLERELNSRGIPVKSNVGKTATEGLTLIINRYQIANRRATGFSPWESFHIFSGTLIKDGKEKKIKAYFYNGKVPVWSMNEIEEPCFTTPISIIIKDVASKINRATFDLRVSDERVNKLTEEIDSEIGKNNYSNFWKVLELGYTNNPKAVESLKRYAQADDDFFKSCALSSIGTLGAADQFEFLKGRYREGRYNDRYMSIKAIGDLGTPETMQFLQAIKKEKDYEKEGGLKYCVDLYAPTN